LINEKSTFVTLLGVEQSQAIAQSLYLSAIEKLQALPCETSLLKEFAELLVKRSS